jgi:hypothetical protein
VQQSSTKIREQVSSPPGFADRAEVESALNEWRHHILKWLGEEHRQAGITRATAADGLAIAHRNPGVMDEDVISILWDDLESSSIRLTRLERVITAIEEMEFPKILVLFSRTNKLKSWPWEGDKWQLPEWNF